MQMHNSATQKPSLAKDMQELDTFIYHISHNLRAPLASILGLTHLAMKHGNKSPEDVDTYFSMIEQSVIKMDTKLGEMLDYSRNSSMPVKIKDIDLEKLLQETYQHMKHLEGHDQIEFQVHVTDHQPFFSDQYRITAILENLISNAVKYSDPQKEKSFIHVNVKVIPEQTVIVLHDNGIGIAENELPKVFNMFYRATANSKGSGLGLYLVGEMMDKLKGNIEITSTHHEETFVTLTIPNNPPPVNFLFKNQSV